MAYIKIKLERGMSYSDFSEALISKGFDTNQAGLCSIQHGKDECYAHVWTVEPELGMQIAEALGLEVLGGPPTPRTVH